MFDYCSKREAEIATALVRELLARGLWIKVNDGEEDVTPYTQDEKIVLEAMNSTDHDILRFGFVNGTVPVGAAVLIWGNGTDLISDYTGDNYTGDLVNCVLIQQGVMEGPDEDGNYPEGR